MDRGLLIDSPGKRTLTIARSSVRPENHAPLGWKNRRHLRHEKLIGNSRGGPLEVTTGNGFCQARMTEHG